jgi:hypothetical protein
MVLSRARDAQLKAIAMRKHRFWNILSLLLFLPRLSSDDWLPWGVKGLGGIDSMSFLVGLSSQRYSLVLWFCWRHRLVAVGQPRESCFVLVLCRSRADVRVCQ